MKRVQAGTPTGGQFAPGSHAEADVALAAVVTAPPVEVKMTELHYQHGTSDKFYRTLTWETADGKGKAVAQWGRTGSFGQVKPTTYDTLAEAEMYADSQHSSKVAKGYVQIDSTTLDVPPRELDRTLAGADIEDYIQDYWVPSTPPLRQAPPSTPVHLTKLDFQEGTSDKFYRIMTWETADGQAKAAVEWGRNGSPSYQSKITTYGSYDEAMTFADKQYRSKVAKGYEDLESMSWDVPNTDMSNFTGDPDPFGEPEQDD